MQLGTTRPREALSSADLDRLVPSVSEAKSLYESAALTS